MALSRVDANTVRDAAGHTLHFGMAAYALAHHASADILREEDYGFGDGAHFDSFALLSDGAVLTYRHAENAVVEERGAFVAAALLTHLAAAVAAAPAAAPAAAADPVAADKARRYDLIKGALS